MDINLLINQQIHQLFEQWAVYGRVSGLVLKHKRHKRAQKLVVLPYLCRSLFIVSQRLFLPFLSVCWQHKKSTPCRPKFNHDPATSQTTDYSCSTTYEKNNRIVLAPVSSLPAALRTTPLGRFSPRSNPGGFATNHRLREV